MNDIKTPPHSHESEQSVIGSLLLNNEAFDKILNIVSAGDFYETAHRILFQTIETMLSQNNPADVITVAERLESSGNLANVGGLAYIGKLAQNTPSATNIAHYAATVRDKSVERGLMAAANSIFDIASGTGTTSGKIDRAQAEIMKVGEQRQSKSALPISKIMSRAVEELDARFHSDGNISGTSTGYERLDEITCGLQDGDLIIVGGRPSMGKTSFAMNIAENVALKSEKTVAVFSLEMPDTQIANRLISSVGKIPLADIRSGKIKPESWERVTYAIKKLMSDKIIVDDTGAIGLMQIRASCRRIKREHGLGLIVVDYIQLMNGEGDNRTNQIGDISRGLKAIAKEFNVPVIALSQLSRELEKRQDKRPKMSDLRDSGAIEQDADLIMFVYRDEVYNPDTMDKGMAEIIIGKQRNGSIGMVPMTFLGEYTRFENFIGMYSVHRQEKQRKGFSD